MKTVKSRMWNVLISTVSQNHLKLVIIYVGLIGRVAKVTEIIDDDVVRVAKRNTNEIQLL